MIVEKIELANFRNYEAVAVSFSEEINILYGDNAQGKTNLLEAVFLCGTTKSHRGMKDKELIKIGCEESHIRLFISKRGIPHRIDMHLRMNKSKGVAVDGIPIRKSSDLFGLLNVVFFSPEDLSMIKNGPSERRRFVDMELCQLNQYYLHTLSEYNKILLQRNNLLKQLLHDKNLIGTLDVWDAQLVEKGIRIIGSRNDFIKQLNVLAERVHKRLTGGLEVLKIVYEPNVSEESFAQELKRQQERDMYLKTTGTGPHRDEYSFYINGENVKKYGSQGQQRTVALSLKLAEIELVQKVTGENPVLLLDDVLSELDRNRQSFLLNNIENIQTIITCTGLEEFVGDRSKYNRTYQIINGTVV